MIVDKDKYKDTLQEIINNGEYNKLTKNPAEAIDNKLRNIV